ncbi:hypothetical protein VP1G_06078 [Cytospora mali]|uniref:Uncharacterized protein n=1 Tax=Cytospora mali TaxID=578113 RepID=A0A194V4K7_CYTMA|nr:hypothetical protein VP1G_06078 [Valsa mali var. pyri (nom. inval.)]
MSPPSSASSQDTDQVDGPPRPSTHKWNHFEVRALICLVIKGEHLTTDDPMHIADKLNMALNPASSRRNPNYNRDIPHDEIQHMLKRILDKKMHAVDVSDRDTRPTITRTKVNAFMRSLGFDGSKDEWMMGRKEKMNMEGEKRQRRYTARKEGAESPRALDERHRRRMMIRGPRARRLLRGWGIGASFWEGDTKGADRLETRSKSQDSRSSGTVFTPVSNGRISYITDTTPAPSNGKEPPFNSIRRNGVTHLAFDNARANPSTTTPNPAVAAWGGGFAPAPMAITPLSTSIMPAQMTPASRYGYGGPGGFHVGPQQPYQSSGWDEGEFWDSLPDSGIDQRHP